MKRWSSGILRQQIIFFMPMKMSDDLKAVLDRIRENEEDAFAELCQRYVECDEEINEILDAVRQKEDAAFDKLSNICIFKSLIARIKRGDDIAFEELHTKYLPLVVRILGVATSARDMIEDGTQDVFASVWKKIVRADSFRSFDDLQAFIIVCAKNKAIDWHRIRGRAPIMHSIADEGENELANPTPNSNPEADLLEKERIVNIMDSILTLTEIDKRAVILHYLEDLKYSEIASMEGISETQVRGRLAHARKKLKKSLRIFNLIVSFLA
jgi:RNA polymerase sigma factor (sigma-70 family)